MPEYIGRLEHNNTTTHIKRIDVDHVSTKIRGDQRTQEFIKLGKELLAKAKIYRDRSKAGFQEQIPVTIEEITTEQGEIKYNHIVRLYITPDYPNHTPETFRQSMQELLADIPKEFHEFVNTYSYEHGHSSGYDETLSIAQELTSSLNEPIKKYTKRIGGCSMWETLKCLKCQTKLEVVDVPGTNMPTPLICHNCMVTDIKTKISITRVRQLLPVGKEFTAEFVGKNRHTAPAHRVITKRRVTKQTSKEMESLIIAENKTIGLAWTGVTAKGTYDDQNKIFLYDQLGEEFLCLTI